METNSLPLSVVKRASIAESQSESSILKMDQSDRRIFSFHSIAILKTAEAPEHEKNT